jgi:mono/diheme cytochrome c family protein
MSFSPRTGLAYIPLQETSYVYSMARDFRPMQGQWNMGNDPRAERPPAAARAVATGALLAWDPAKQAPAWRVELGASWNGGTLATAGNLVMQGAADGRLVVYRADSGEKLWEMPIQTGAVAGPISYGVDGEQYLAVAAGWAGAAALWGGDRERAKYEAAEARVLAFKLDGAARLPPPPGLKQPPRPPRSTGAEEVIARGKEMYDATCATCHGVNAVAGIMPDLRHMTAETHAQFEAIVLGGARLGGGMPAFADKYGRADAEAIHAWLIQRANEDWR